ncbi:nucleolin-like [Cynara cardunculus var. scolymus]|uniref:nucleolin-like n=1 Tax=Cynara cardunculus var. scolymus TaxID=59895 RepID=UPI000D62B2BC|nr:nucleolin-like [Cynara cardunculus var. scolymus]
MQVEALSNLEQPTEDSSLRLDDLTSCIDNDKEREKYQHEKITMENVDAAADAELLGIILQTKDAITTNDDDTNDDDDAMIAPATHEVLPITSVSKFGDEENDDEEDVDEDPLLPDAGQDLGDDDDEEDFTIQYHPRLAPAQNGVSLRESASQGEKTTRNQHSSTKDKGVAEQGNPPSSSR